MNQTSTNTAQLLDHMETALIVLQPDRTLRFLNAAAETLLERSASRMHGENILAVLQIPKLDRMLDEVQTNLNRVVKREIPLISPGGKATMVNLSMSPLPEQCVLLEVQQIDHQLDISQNETRQNEYQATRKLLRGMAHEIKNPLGGIRGAAQLLSRLIPGNGVEEYTNVIIAEADRLRLLVDRMLGPQQPPTLRPINVHEAVEQVFRLINAEARPEVHVVRDYDPSIPETLADKDQLIQAILNVARNAMESIGDRGEITFRTRVLRRYHISTTQVPLVIQISIEDNGPGIPEELQSEIFFPMVTSKAQGTGLGLSITQSLIQNHCGLVKFHSLPGKTCFEILLPVRDQP